jgi:hypothetical protein
MRTGRLRWNTRALAALAVVGLAAWLVAAVLVVPSGAAGREDEGWREYPPSAADRDRMPLADGRGLEALRRDGDRAEAAQRARRAELSSQEAVAEREGSQSAFEELSASASLGLVSRLFGKELDRLQFDPASELRGNVERFLSDHVAVMRRGAQRLLVESTVPLRAGEDDRVVDLSLQRVADGWTAANPLVAVKLPNRLSEGIALGGDGLGVSVAGADSLGVSDGEGRVLYPEVARDTDVVAFPLPHGVEVAGVVRSARAPGSLTLGVELPEGASLEQGSDGGAAIMEGERRVASVLPPVASDANGESVRVSMQVIGERSLRLALDEDAREKARYPILIDPVVDAQGTGWYTGNPAGISNWYTQTNGGGYSFRTDCYAPVSCYPPTASTDRGLHIYIPNFGTMPFNTYGLWGYLAPGTTSYITDATWQHIWLQHRDPQIDPYMFLAISSRGQSASGWAALQSFPGVSLADATLAQSSAPYTDGGSLAFGFYSRVNQPLGPNWRDGYIGGVTVTMTDPENPSGPSISHSNTQMASGWVSSGSDTVTASSTDPGLGIRTIAFSGTGSTDTRNHGCTGGQNNPCPSSWSQTKTINASGLDEGVTTATATVLDAPGHQSTATWQYKIDRSQPVASIAGDGWNDAAGVIAPGERSVTVVGNDPLSGVKSIDVQIDGMSLSGFPANQSCSAGGCSMTRTATYNTNSYAGGQHTIKVIVTDQVGNTYETSKPVTFLTITDPAPARGCDTPSALTIGSGYVGAGNYVGLKAESVGNAVRVCWHAASGALLNASGVIRVAGATLDPNTLPAVDGGGELCYQNNGNVPTFQRDNPSVVGGTTRISRYTPPGGSEVWVCVESGSMVDYRLILRVPQGTVPTVTPETTMVPVAPPPPKPWPLKASKECEAGGGPVLVNYEVAGQHVWLGTQSAGTTAKVCVRQQGASGVAGAGGVVRVSPTTLPGDIGISDDLTPCTEEIDTSQDAPRVWLTRSAGTDPLSVCVDTVFNVEGFNIPLVQKRFFVGAGGGNPLSFELDG